VDAAAKPLLGKDAIHADFRGTGPPNVLRAKLVFEIKALAEKIKGDGWDSLTYWEPDFSLALGA